MAYDISPSPLTVPTVDECLKESARTIRGAEMMDDPNKAAIMLEAGNRWMELAAVVHGIRAEAE